MVFVDLRSESTDNLYMVFFFTFFQVSIQRGMGTRDPNMNRLTKTKMVIGCLLEMFRGRCSCHPAQG